MAFSQVSFGLRRSLGLHQRRLVSRPLATASGQTNNSSRQQNGKRGGWTKQGRKPMRKKPMRGAAGVERSVPEGMRLVPLSVREEIFKQYTLDPQKNSFTALARKYNYRAEKVAGIIRLVEREKDIEAEEGFEALGTENLDEAARLLFGQAVEQMPPVDVDAVMRREANIKYIQVGDSYDEKKIKETKSVANTAAKDNEGDADADSWTKLDEELKDKFWKGYKAPSDVFKTEGKFVFRDISKPSN